MDDSERSYGYSRDIYHGRRGPGGHYGNIVRRDDAGRYYPDQPHFEESYEVGPEWSTGEPWPGEYGPEAAAVRVRRGVGEARRGNGGRGGRPWDVPGPHRGRGPKGYQRLDERIHEDLCDRLRDHGMIDASAIEVRVENGEVTLTGQVSDRGTKRLVEDVADTVSGVVDVHNRLFLRGAEDPGDPLIA